MIGCWAHKQEGVGSTLTWSIASKLELNDLECHDKKVESLLGSVCYAQYVVYICKIKFGQICVSFKCNIISN